jgi:hypothetical protein
MSDGTSTIRVLDADTLAEKPVLQSMTEVLRSLS